MTVRREVESRQIVQKEGSDGGFRETDLGGGHVVEGISGDLDSGNDKVEQPEDKRGQGGVADEQSSTRQSNTEESCQPPSGCLEFGLIGLRFGLKTAFVERNGPWSWCVRHSQVNTVLTTTIAMGAFWRTLHSADL